MKHTRGWKEINRKQNENTLAVGLTFGFLMLSFYTIIICLL